MSDVKNYLQWARLGKIKVWSSWWRSIESWGCEVQDLECWKYNNDDMTVELNETWRKPKVCVPWIIQGKLGDGPEDTQMLRTQSIIYEIKTGIAITKPINFKVIEYFSFIANLWQEMDLYKKVKLCLVETLKLFFKKERHRNFLAGQCGIQSSPRPDSLKRDSSITWSLFNCLRGTKPTSRDVGAGSNTILDRHWLLQRLMDGELVMYQIKIELYIETTNENT